MWYVTKHSIFHGDECQGQIYSCSPEMVTSQKEWKILVWDTKMWEKTPNRNKQNNKDKFWLTLALQRSCDYKIIFYIINAIVSLYHSVVWNWLDLRFYIIYVHSETVMKTLETDRCFTWLLSILKILIHIFYILIMCHLTVSCSCVTFGNLYLRYFYVSVIMIIDI